MATIGKYQGATQSERVQRYFSEEFKQKKVRKVEHNLVTVVQISLEYNVSHAAVYRRVYKYSSMRKKGVKQVLAVY